MNANTILRRATLAAALLPLANAALNTRLIRRLPPRNESSPSASPVSVLIPARNEGLTIGAAITSLLANRGATFEIVVLDDGSTDDTAAIVAAFDDPRVRLIEGRPLPSGWAGKNHACVQLAAAATHPLLLFLDADVRLAPDAIARLSAAAGAPGSSRGPDLLSGVPRQRMETALEWLLLPMMHVLTSGYLPLAFDRGHNPALAAACGQLVLVRADSYRAMHGHAAMRGRLHDALALARAMRRAGYRTQLMDVTDLATCRMYDSAAAVWTGLGKNATEGLATRLGLPVWTALLGLAHVAPFLQRGSPAVWTARAASLALRAVVARRHGQGARTVLASPLGVALLLALQWQAYARHALGRTVTWKGRTYETT